MLTSDLLNRISENINSSSKIILTADHGLSRLAVLAHEVNLDKTLPFKYGEPDDWRYSKIPHNNDPVPEGIEKQTYGGQPYWIVRGYDRLPKSGGKKYELHGGATLEERLVPFIVISKNTSSIPEKEDKPKSQLKIKDDFDI